MLSYWYLNWYWYLTYRSLSCTGLLLSLLWETAIIWFHKGGFNEERRFHGHTPPRLCDGEIPAGDSGDVLSGPAFVPQAWSCSWFVAVYI